jgi:hypothetical protein
MIRDEIVAQTDLSDAITEALKRKGVYSKMKAQLRAEVYHTLEDKTTPDVQKVSRLISVLCSPFPFNSRLSSALPSTHSTSTLPPIHRRSRGTFF